jgi:lysyl-tRNA synthetase class 1
MSIERKMVTAAREFWLDKLARQVHERFPNEPVIHLSCGLSIRGPQHVGRMRGELCIPDSVKRVLEERYERRVIHYVVLYDMDPQKLTPLQIAFSEDPEAQQKYAGVSLRNIPDPHGCCASWQDHFWQDFGPYLSQFGFDVQIVRTSEFYQMAKTREVIKQILGRRERVIELVNRFRGERPWPPDYIPIKPICENCLSIEHTDAVSFDLDAYTVDYVCRRCGQRGTTSLVNAKLTWRLEWSALWRVLHIEFEPYGKDHAAAGGSRETCGIFSTQLFDYPPPLGEWNEWVSLKKRGEWLGEMTASGFVGITPRQWLEIGEPEVLRYLYVGTVPHTAITIDLDRIPAYHDDYDRAERVYHGVQQVATAREAHNIRRAFELAQIRPIPTSFPFQLSYTFAAQLAQILPRQARVQKAIQLLRRIGQLTRRPTQLEKEHIERRLALAENWINRYAPDRYKIRLVDKLTNRLLARLTNEQREALRRLGTFLEQKRSENEVWDAIRQIAQDVGIAPERVFEAAYVVLLGRARGPRLVPFILTLDRPFVVRRFKLEG